MFAKIAPTCEPEESVQVLNRFDHEWWYEASERAQGKLEFTVEYR